MNKVKQVFFKYVTNPIATGLDYINIPKRIKLNRLHKKLAQANKNDYIQTTANLLMEKEIQEHMIKGEMPNPLLIPIILARHLETAYRMFEEKKANGDFDELNIMIN